MIYTIIGVIILILALILLAILLIPFHISFYIQKREMNISGNFKIRWLKIRIIQRDIPTEKKEEEKKEVKKERKFNLEQVLKILNQFIEAFDYITPLIPAFLRSITLKKVSLNLNLGFYSPVDTAMINGYIWSISSILNTIPLISISTTPDFQESKLDGSFELNLKLKLLWIVIASLKAFTKKPVRDLVGSIRNLNK